MYSTALARDLLVDNKNSQQKKQNMERQDFIYGLLGALSADELVQLHNELTVLTDDMDNEFFAMENFDTVTDGMANYEIFRATAMGCANPYDKYFRFSDEGNINSFSHPCELRNFDFHSMSGAIDGIDNRYSVYLLPYIGETIRDFDNNEVSAE